MTAGAEHRAVGFGEAVSLFFKNYVVFEGRSSRGAYWWPFLLFFLIGIVLGVLDGAMSGGMGGSIFGILSTVVSLATVIPSIAAGIRRMHDTDRSGWWILLPIVNIIFMAQPGQRAANRFGPDVEAGR